MFRNDLSPCDYGPPGDRALNVGWLDAEHEFTRGRVSELVLSRLKEFVSSGYRRTRGYHLCELCPAPSSGRKEPALTSTTLGEVRLGSAELCVVSENGTSFISPNLLVHYVEVHGYQPPQPFLDAIVGGKAC